MLRPTDIETKSTKQAHLASIARIRKRLFRRLISGGGGGHLRSGLYLVEGKDAHGVADVTRGHPLAKSNDEILAGENSAAAEAISGAASR